MADEHPDVAAAAARALATLERHFDGLAVVRGGRVQVLLHRAPGRTRLLLATTATATDRAAMLAGIRDGDRVRAIASELLGLALAVPSPHGLRRILELGAALGA